MTLSELVRASAARMADVSVDIDSLLETVTISSDGEEDIFMQGDDARSFIAEVESLYEKTGDMSKDDCAALVAEPYTEFWS